MNLCPSRQLFRLQFSGAEQWKGIKVYDSHSFCCQRTLPELVSISGGASHEGMGRSGQIEKGEILLSSSLCPYQSVAHFWPRFVLQEITCLGGALHFWHLPSNCKFKASFSEWCLARARICSLTENKLPLIVQEDCPPVSPLIKQYMAPNRKSSPFLDLLLKSLCSSDVRLFSLPSPVSWAFGKNITAR